MKYSLIIVLVCLFGCKAQKKTESVSMEKMDDATLLVQDYHSGFQEYEASIIRDSKTLGKVYGEINKTRKPGLRMPKIDFTQEQVILLCLGKQYGDKTPVLSKLEETTENLLLAVALNTENEDNQANTLPISYPFYIYKMPITSKNIDFKKVDW